MHINAVCLTVFVERLTSLTLKRWPTRSRSPDLENKGSVAVKVKNTCILVVFKYYNKNYFPNFKKSN